MTDPLIEAREVRKTYRRGEVEVQALRDVDLLVDPGEYVAVVGPSGSGKTTLLNCLAGLDTVDEGTVRVDGTDLAAMGETARTRFRAREMGFIFQHFNLVDVLTAERNVAMPLLLQGVDRGSARERARRALAQVGLAERRRHRPTELSGGQRQRVAIARALVHEPTIVWADEPTGNLDRATGDGVLDLLDRLNSEQGITFVVVSHDPAVAQAADRVVRMDSGRVVDGATPRRFQVVNR